MHDEAAREDRDPRPLGDEAIAGEAVPEDARGAEEMLQIDTPASGSDRMSPEQTPVANERSPGLMSSTEVPQHGGVGHGPLPAELDDSEPVDIESSGVAPPETERLEVDDLDDHHVQDSTPEPNPPAADEDSAVKDVAQVAASPHQVPKRWTALLVVLTLLTAANLFLTWTASNGRGAGVQALRSIVSQPLVASSAQPAGRRNSVSIVAEGGRRPVLSTVRATSGFPRSNSEVRVLISGIEDSSKGVSQLEYLLVQTTEGGRLELDFPDGVAGKINGTITVTIAPAPRGGATALVAQGYQV